MSRTRPLLPGDYADGARVVETTLRPVRPAVLIPEDDPDMAARFARSRSLAWGGHVGYALPYSPSEGLREPWRRLLDLLDPDMVHALGMSHKPLVSPGVVRINAPREKPPRPLADRLSDDLGRMVYTREKPEELFLNASALMHSVLDAVGEDLKPPDSEWFVAVPKLSQWSSFRLPLMARYGGVNDAELEGTLKRVYSPQYRFNLDLSKLVRVKEVSVTGDLLGVLSGDVSGLLDDDVREHALTLPELTLLGLRIRGTAGLRRPQDPASGSEEIRYRPIVVTGSDNSVEDFALFWNLRSEHYFAKPFPMWIPIDLLEDAEAPAAIERALERVPRAVGEASPRMDDVLIVSASMDATELWERLRGRFSEARISADDLIGLFTETCEYYYTTEKLPAYFDRGRASIQPPRPEELKKSLFRGDDYVACEVGVDGMWLPQGKAMAQHLGWPDFESRDKISKRGNLRYVKVFSKRFSERDLIELRTPDGWTLLHSVFEEHGYDISPTAKAASALGQLELIGGAGNLEVLASSKVRQLLRVLSRRRGEKRPFVAERKTLKFEHFRARWGREAARDVLRWLVKRRVVFRGAILECPRCRLSGWYVIDRVDEVWRCDGCQENLPVPLELDKTDWHYRINELYAHGHNQGTLTPLLTLHAMAGAWGGQPSREDLGFYPGVELNAKKGARVPFPRKEVDLVALRGRDLVLAECKESTEHLAAPEKAAEFARQIAEMVVLADYLGASRLLVASSTMYPVEKETLLRETPADHAAEVLWLDGHDLLDPYYFANPLAFPGASGGAGKPEKWDEEYLELLRTSLADADG